MSQNPKNMAPILGHSAIEKKIMLETFFVDIMYRCRSKWPRGLRRRSAAAPLLRSWVRIPPGGHGCLSVVSVVCCQVEVSAMG